MGWDAQKKLLAEFDAILRQLKVEIGPDAPIVPQLTIMREFLADHSTVAEQELLAKWNHLDFKLFYDAAIVVGRLTQAVVALQNQPAAELRKRLKTVLSGSLVQNFSPEQAKDILYELEVAHFFQEAGFIASLREPDVVVSGNGLTQELGMACKYPSSEAQVHAHVSKGIKQIENQGLRGCVVLGMDVIVFRQAFNSAPKFLDFRGTDRHPLAVAQDLVNEAMKALVVQRSNDYPAERPIDGAILTLSMWGAWGKPAGLTSLTAWAVQCDRNSPALKDVGRLVEASAAITKAE